MVLYLIDEALGMLHPYAEGKGLGLQKPALAMEQAVDVASRMACGQDDGHAPVLVAFAVRNTQHTLFSPLPLYDKVCHAGGEMVFAAVLFDCMAHVGYDAAQPVGADMCVRVDGNGGVGSVLYETSQHILDIPALGAAGVELAVGIGACTAFTETPVAFGVHLMCTTQLGDVKTALLHRLSTLDDNGFQPRLEGAESSKEPCRAGTNDNDRRAVVAVAIMSLTVGSNVVFATVHLDGSVVAYSPPRVEAATQHLHMGDVVHMQVCLMRHGAAKQVVRTVFSRGEVYVNDFSHDLNKVPGYLPRK